jgi:hypothetical protein
MTTPKDWPVSTPGFKPILIAPDDPKHFESLTLAFNGLAGRAKPWRTAVSVSNQGPGNIVRPGMGRFPSAL